MLLHATTVLLIRSLAAFSAGDPVDPDLYQEILNDTDVASPSSMVFLGPEEVLVSEKITGKVKHFKDWQPVGEALDVNVANASGCGFLSLELDPDFANNQHVYCCYSECDGDVDGGNWVSDIIERYTWNGSTLSNGTGALFRVRATPIDKLFHHSGVLRFGPDDKLYGQVGEMGNGRPGNSFMEQNTGWDSPSGRGAIFRLNPDGSFPPDNPFVNEDDPRVHHWYMYGFRNSFGMDFDPQTGTLWSTDNGPELWDELNRIDAGMNSGWVLILGPDDRDAVVGDNNFTAYDAADLVYLDGAFYRDPEFSWYNPIGATSVLFLTSRVFPEKYWDAMIVGSSAFPRHLYWYELTADRQQLVLSGGTTDKVADGDAERDQHKFLDSAGTCTDLRVGPDGYLYQLNYSGNLIRRIRPVEDLLGPTWYEPQAGEVLRGTVKHLAVDDDKVVRLGPPSSRIGRKIGQQEEVRQICCTFRVFSQDPTAMHLQVKTRNNTMAAQTISIWNAELKVWVELDTRLVGTTAQRVALDDLPSPLDYVDPSDRSVRVRVTEMRSAATTTGGSPTSLKSSFDQVRLRVSYR